MKVGIIGGNGVAATNRLCEMIEIKRTSRGAFRDAHHPEMIVWQATKAPSRSMYLEGRGPNWIPDYIDIAKKFKYLDCDLGCMCCNTAHYAIDQIASESGLRFINLLEETAAQAKATGLRRFELFCSDGARKFNLYGKVFTKIFPEAEIIYPSETCQKEVTQVICDIKNKTRFLPPSDPMSPCARLMKLSAEAEAPVVLGCTDLRVAYPSDKPLQNSIVVDSLECLADAILREYDEATKCP